MAKLERPAAVLSRCSSDNTWITTAVDDIASARPITAALIRLYPSRTAAPASTPAQSTSCKEPRPNTSRRITLRRSNDSSRPITNSSSTTPRRAIGSIDSGSPILVGPRPGRERGERGGPKGADCDTNQHEAEHRADMQAVEQRDDDGGGAEDDQRLLVEGGVERGSFHPRNLAARGGIRLAPILSPPRRKAGVRSHEGGHSGMANGPGLEPMNTRRIHSAHRARGHGFLA